MQEAQKMQVHSLGWEDPLQEDMATYSSILAWRIPRTEKLTRLVHGVMKSQTCMQSGDMEDVVWGAGNSLGRG